MSSVQPHSMSNRGLPSSFSEQSRGPARPQRSLFSTTDGDTGDVPLPERMVNESHKHVQKSKKRSRKHKPTRQVPSSFDVERNSERPQKRHCSSSRSPETATGRHTAVEVIDLTVDVEHCAICPNVLGHGQGYVSRMFVFTSCGCVLCGECLLGNIQEQERGSSFAIKDVCCPKGDHFNKGKQEACQIFGLECAICYTASVDEIDQVAPSMNYLIRTSCGHTFCRRCIQRWTADQEVKNCPSCRLDLEEEEKLCCRFKTIQRGVVCK